MEETLPIEQTPQKNEPRLVWAAVILTLLFPGLGHIYNGEPKRGIGLLTSGLITLISLAILLGLFPSLLTLILVFGFEIFFLIYLIFDSARIAKSKKNYFLKKYNRWYFYILIVLTGSFTASSVYFPLISNYIVQGYDTPTTSMEGTILIEDHFFANRFTFKIGDSKPRRNDIVIFESEGMRDEVSSTKKANYVKRIAGIPGDTIRLVNYLVYINGSLQPTPPFARLPAITYDHTKKNPDIFPKGSPWNEENYGPVIIPKRNDIIHLNVENIDGWKVFIEREKHSVLLKDSTILIDNTPAAEYRVQRNYYFMLGDTRNNSLDSRYYGFIPEENIIGQPTIIYWSWEDEDALYDKFKTIRWDRIGREIK